MGLIETFTLTWLDSKQQTAQTRFFINSDHIPYQIGSSDYENHIRSKVLVHMFLMQNLSGAVIVNASRSREVDMPDGQGFWAFSLNTVPAPGSDVKRQMKATLRTDDNTITHVTIPGWLDDYTAPTSFGERVPDFTADINNQEQWAALMHYEFGNISPADFMPISDYRGNAVVAGVRGVLRFRAKRKKHSS